MSVEPPGAGAASPSDDLLASACAQWQSGRDGGSSRLRGAARVLTGTPHYFDAPFIRDHERGARADAGTLLRAAGLLGALRDAPLLEADGWNRHLGLPERGFAGRGIQANPGVEAQILESLGTGRLTMPLWGLTLDPAVADSYGCRFRFEIDGQFAGVAAWVHSGVTAEEQEIIAGGSYEVVQMAQEGVTTVVRLRFLDPPKPQVGSDPVLLDLMSDLADARSSTLEETPDGNTLTMQLDGEVTLRAQHTLSRSMVVSVEAFKLGEGSFSAEGTPAEARPLARALLEMLDSGPVPAGPGLLTRVRSILDQENQLPSIVNPVHRPSWLLENDRQVAIEARSFGDAGGVTRWLKSAGFVTSPANWDYGYDDTVAVLAGDRPDLHDPVSTFREVERMRDEGLLNEEYVQSFVAGLTAELRSCAGAPGDPWDSTGSLDLPEGGYVQWTRVAEVGTPIHLELADDSEYSQPLDPALVSLLCDFGWEAPNDQFRNAWLQIEPEAGLNGAAELVARTLVLGLGLTPPRLPLR